MAFRVVPGTPNQPGNGEVPPANTGVSIRPGTIPARSAPLDAQAVLPLVERLETLSFTFEALNASSRTYAAEAVLETLGRMERRDLQSLAAIEAFASALKTVSQHLAGLRNAIQTTAQDTASGFEIISHRMDELETRLGQPALPGANPLALIAERLTGIEERMGQDGFDVSPLTELLENVVHKVEAVEEKIDDLPNKITSEPVDMAPVTTHLEDIALRVASVERKIDEAQKLDVAPLREALETIGQRVARIETRMESQPDTALPEPFDPHQITEVLDAISQRIASMENRVEAGPDLGSLTSFLGMVSDRLERMENGLGMVEGGAEDSPEAQARPVAAPKPEPEPMAAAPIPAVSPPPPPAAVNTMPPPAAVNTMPPPAEAATRQQVDNLLEQVLKVLSR